VAALEGSADAAQAAQVGLARLYAMCINRQSEIKTLNQQQTPGSLNTLVPSTQNLTKKAEGSTLACTVKRPKKTHAAALEA
jgi:hypothetical protein